MKATLTSALSMVAILGTGGAALAVNATVLDPQEGSTQSSTPPTAATQAPETTPSSVADEFQIPGVGLVSMTTVDGQLFLRSVEANDGFSYTVIEIAPGEYEVKFESSDRVVTFTARLFEGQIVTTATGMDTPPPVAPPATTPTTASTNSSSESGSSGGGGPSDSGHFDGDDHDDDEYGDIDFGDDDFDFDDDDHGGGFGGGFGDGDDDD